MVASGAVGPRARGPVDPQARVAAVAVRHERALLRVARQASICDDDAADAYQRALEIFVRRVESVDPATELAWLRVVVRHEALAIRRARSESVTGEDLDLDAFVPSAERSVEERMLSDERVRRSAEALRTLKPDEAQALMMKAHGLSYDEIARANGWSYTKVNRAITEGRRRFMNAYEGLESGEGCARYAPIVEALAAGSASSAQIVEIRPHLRHCIACRAAVRDLHVPGLRRASLLTPLFAALEPIGRFFARADDDAGRPDEVVHPEQLIRPEDIVPPDVSAETSEALSRLAALKNDISALLFRANASDVATGIHIASTAGGGRVASLGALIAVCLSSVGVGTVCVVAGLLPEPTPIVRREEPPVAKQRPDPRPAREAPAAPILARELLSVRPTPTPEPTPTPAADPPRERRRPSPRNDDPSQGTTPTSHEQPPISPVPANAVTASGGQESFTPEVPQGPAEPAAAPATGGGEFIP